MQLLKRSGAETGADRVRKYNIRIKKTLELELQKRCDFVSYELQRLSLKPYQSSIQTQISELSNNMRRCRTNFRFSTEYLGSLAKRQENSIRLYCCPLSSPSMTWFNERWQEIKANRPNGWKSQGMCQDTKSAFTALGEKTPEAE